MKTLEKLPLLWKEDTRPCLAEMSRIDIVRQMPCGYKMSIYGTQNHFVYFKDSYLVKIMGPRIFYKETSSVQLTFKNGKFYGTILPGIMSKLLELFGIDWITKSDWCYKILGTNKTLWAMVLKGKITNPESLCKRFSRMYFKGVYSYKNLKELYQGSRYHDVDLWSLYYYSDNPDLLLRRLLTNEVTTYTVRDVFKYCRMYDTKINANWSERRLLEEHDKQMEEESLERASEFSDETITKEHYAEGGLNLLLDERSAFIEGIKMHNCVHSCYWTAIKQGEYLIACGKVDGIHIDLGMRYQNDTLVFEQVSQRHNKSVSENIQSYCEEWITKNQSALRDIVQQIKYNSLSWRRKEPFGF